MKYTCETEINKPIGTVVELFDNPDHMSKWMEGLQSFEHLSGTPGQPGAKSRLKFKHGNREMELIETIIVRNLPKEFSGTYEAKGIYNHLTNRFTAANANTTKYSSEVEFQFSGMMKLFGFLMPGMFKKQSVKYMNAFKHFVENYGLDA
jgi:carbon monoxide dehydrogenase subunit G